MEAHITYIDEQEKQKNGWFKITELNTGYITFLTENNKITLPMNRVIKIKERGGQTE